MSFLRPELAAMLRRWREPLAGVALAIAGLWWALRTGGAAPWLGIAVAGLGGLTVWLGWQRAARHGPEAAASLGPGIVAVREGQIAYFGPDTGGVADLDALVWVALERPGDPARPVQWVLGAAPAGGTEARLSVPVTARGADRLFDVLAALPGFPSGHARAVVARPVTSFEPLWCRPGAAFPPSSRPSLEAPRGGD